MKIKLSIIVSIVSKRMEPKVVGSYLLVDEIKRTIRYFLFGYLPPFGVKVIAMEPNLADEVISNLNYSQQVTF